MFRPMHSSLRDKRHQQLWLELMRRIAEGFDTIPGGGGSVFVYQPGGARLGNVFASWPDLVAAARTVGGNKWVCFDDSLAPCSIPEGTWDFGSYTVFQGRACGTGQAPLVELTCKQGCRLLNVFEFLALNVASDSDEPVCNSNDYPDVVGNTLYFRLGMRGSLTIRGSAPFYKGWSGPSMTVWWVTEDARIVSGSQTIGVFEARGRGPVILVCATDAANVEQYTLAWDRNASCTGLIVNSGANIETKQVTGDVGIVLLENALREAYDPGDPSQWAAPPPTTQQQALDRLAVAVAGLLRNPIP